MIEVVIAGIGGLTLLSTYYLIRKVDTLSTAVIKHSTDELERIDELTHALQEQNAEELAPYIDSRLSQAELDRMERDENFELRISRIKDELAATREQVRGTGIDADILHPGVSNLPHSIISEDHSNSDVDEYAK